MAASFLPILYTIINLQLKAVHPSSTCQDGSSYNARNPQGIGENYEESSSLPFRNIHIHSIVADSDPHNDVRVVRKRTVFHKQTTVSGQSCDVEPSKLESGETAEKKKRIYTEHSLITSFTLPSTPFSNFEMCPHQNGDVLPSDPSQMVQVPLTNGHAPPTNGKRGTAPRINAIQEKRNPYAPRAADFLSNISNFNIIESTLRGLLSSIFTNQIVSLTF